MNHTAKLILTIVLIALVLCPPTTLASWSPTYRGCIGDRNVDCQEERTLHDQLLIASRNGAPDTANLDASKSNSAETEASGPTGDQIRTRSVRNAQPTANLDKYKPDPAEIEANNYTQEQIWTKTIQNAQQRLVQLGQWRTFMLWATYWSCEDNNNYECMRIDNAERLARGAQPIKYHGKWPFLRVLGCQEIASTLFSIANFVPFFYYYFHLADQLPQTYWMKPIWFAYTISGMNTWLWSTAFHARDNVLTERLDYFFATFSILFLLNIVIIRLFKIPKLGWSIPILLSLAYFSWHCYTLHYIDFDYDWNMTMMVTFGITYCCLFFLWALINPKAHHRWKIVLANVLILIFASCEVFDFPPYFHIFDAHSVWHGATPICTFLTFSFAIDDAQYLHRIEMAKD